MRARRAILADLAKVKGQIDDLYWTFTRTARGKPPVLVRPDLYATQAVLWRELRAWQRRRRR